MKTIHMTATWVAAEVLQLVNVNEPAIITPGQIKVQLKAACIYLVDTKLRSRGVLYPDALPAILGCDGAGKLKPLVSTTLPLEGAARAHQLVEAGHVQGKIVLTI